MKSLRPPRFADRFLRWYCSEQYIEEVQGDLHEWFARRVEKSGVFRAKCRYMFDVIAYMRLFRIKKIDEMENGNNLLFWNYLKMAIRQFQRNRWYASLNILGLTVGILGVMLISLYILDELSYDRFHKDHESIYRLVNYSPASGRKGDATPSPWKANMTDFFPEISEHTRLGQDNILVTDDGRRFLENDFYWADANFLTFFSFKVLQGDPATMLTAPNSIVLTRSKALRYFGKVEVVGERMPIRVYDGNQDFLMQVTGVIEDVPGNSHLQFDFLGSMSTTAEMYGHFERWWGLNWLKSYVKLPENMTPALLEAKVPQFFEERAGEGQSKNQGILFQPLRQVRLHSADIEGKIEKGDMNYIYLFGCVAVLILLAASINYVNLTTANATKRSKEVGMRKVFGAARKQVGRQFYIECLLQLVVAFVLAFGLASFLLPTFSTVVGKGFLLSDLLAPNVLLLLLAVFLFILLLAGSYPALVMNRFRPIDVLRGSQSKRLGGKGLFRKVQVLVQFAIAVFLISSTLIVLYQMKFFREFDKGFNPEQLVTIPVDDRELQKKLVTIKEQMQQVPGVKSITATGESLPSAMNNTWGFTWPSNDQDMMAVDIVAVDHDYFKTIETDVVLGRNYAENLASDSLQACMLNEAAFALTGWQEVENQRVTISDRERVLIGVVADYHYSSLHNKVAPTAYLIIPPGVRASPDNLIIRMDVEEASSTLASLESAWKMFTDQPFEFQWVDQRFARLYGDEERFMQVVVGFAILGVFLSVIGLVGLISFMAERRSREISIRKVLGASQQLILTKVGGQFLQLFLIAIVFALPLSRWVMEQWLQEFAYRITISWEVFVVAALVSALIALLSVGGKALKIARANPVKHLSDNQ